MDQGTRSAVLPIDRQENLLRGSVSSTEGRWVLGPPEAGQQASIDKALAIESPDGWGSLPAKQIFPAQVDLVYPGQFGLDRSAQEVVRRALEERKQFFLHMVRAL